MKDYVIVTDSTCDLSAELEKELEIVVFPLTFTIDGKDYANYLDGRDMPLKEFYTRMLNGSTPKTSQLNCLFVADNLRKILDTGKDILYISFSSGLSGSYNAARVAIEDLADDYKDSKIELVDSLCASGGQGVLVYQAVMNKKNGATLEENAKYVENLKLRIKHSFTVLDVEYLKRGGRLNPGAAFAAKLLNIKPVLHVDNAGKLVALAKKHGRRAALNTTLENALDGITTKEEFVTIICGADCKDDVDYCKEYLENKYKELNVNSKVITTEMGPVIGAHAGPGTVAVFTVCDKR